MIDINAYLGHFAFRRLRHNTAAGLLKVMDAKGIKKAVVSSAAAIAYRNSQGGNEELAEEVERHRGRLIPFAVLNPAYAGWRDDLKTCNEKFGMKGLRLYPHWHNYRLGDPACVALVNAATERNMLITIPMRVEDPRQRTWLLDIPDLSPVEVEPLIRACPRAKIVMVNGGGYGRLGRRDGAMPGNVWVDVGRMSAVMANELGSLIKSMGADRILLGTGMPFQYPDPALLKVEVQDISAEDKEKIRSRNAAALLGI
ncbi:MAG TPA: amidohydrolase family protein [Bryobacteraceae bacterium]|nr:amidohydrolase family protein [Bryobacteraceae bacterium]